MERAQYQMTNLLLLLLVYLINYENTIGCIHPPM